MSHPEYPPFTHTRRAFFQTSLGLAAGAVGLMVPGTANAEAPSRSHQAAMGGSPDPFPIPWLDRNGKHNQVPGPDQEPSHIYHFEGLVARSNDFKGLGTDNRGRRIAFGAPTTDFGFMHGSFIANDGTRREGTFAHL